MIGNYKLQPNYGLEADNHKSTTTISSPTVNSTMMNHHHFNDYQENENTSGKFEPDRCIIANLHNYSQPISKQHHRVHKHEYSSENDDDEDDDNVEEEEDEEIVEEHDEKQLKPNINNNSNQEVDDNTPEHHTRRPMNAFLMFCKRHRSIVREKFPNLENRAITKILGDWWANIDEGEKVSYTNLAKEYKDAFFSAHPNFKWYKLPAPPLRTLPSRPSPFDRTSTSISEDDHDYGEPHIANYKCIQVKHEMHFEEVDEYEEEEEEADHADNNESEIKSDNNECTKLINNKLNSIEHNISVNEISILNVNNNESENNGFKDKILIDCKKIMPSSSVPPVTLFKFADIKQMGGLNSLMQVDNQNVARDGSSRNNAATSNNEMGESNEAFIKYSEPFTNMRDHANKMQEDSKISKTNISNNLKRKMNSATTTSPTSPPYNMNTIIYEPIDTPPKFKRNLTFVLNNNNNDFAVNNNNHNIGKETLKNESVGKKSPRACKGQRYKEFMINSGKFPNSPNSNVNHINTGHNKKSTNKINKSGMNGSATMLIRGGGAMSQFPDGSYLDNDAICDANSMNNKHFATEEFDLEKRIKALPSLNLDLFMVRKRETKKKKKLSKRGKSSKAQQSKSTINEAQERAHHYLNKVGSQKRKARKESITRIDVVIKNDNNSNDYSLNSPCQINSPLGFSSNNNNNNNNNNKDNNDIINDPVVIVNQSSSTATSNLFILATLAEEEANKTKMQIT